MLERLVDSVQVQAIFFMACLFGCGKGTSGLRFAKVVGENDLIMVERDGGNIPERFRNILRAIGKISNGCTGGHIGGGYVVTAGHCFTSTYSSVLRKDVPCGGYVYLTWGPGNYLTSSCQNIELLEYHRDRDFALMKVYPVPKVSLKSQVADVVERTQKITIFSYAKKTQNLVWSQECDATILRKPTSILGKMTYSCDTVSGSSGAPLIDAVTHRVIGVHNGAGSFFEFWNYGTMYQKIP